MKITHLFPEVSFQNHRITPTQQLEGEDAVQVLTVTCLPWEEGTHFQLLAMSKVH